MKGEIIKIGDDYGVKWSDLHSFAHGTLYNETILKDNDLKGYKLGDYVDVEFITTHYEEDFHPAQLAVIGTVDEEMEFQGELNEVPSKKSKYTREEYNKRFLREIEEGELTPELKWLFSYLCIDVLNRKRFAGFTEKVKQLCMMRAYEALLKHWSKFNPEKGTEPFSYFVIIIRSSVAGTWCEYNKRK